ncbi:hypothetical protein JL721_2466 [Aureococcus anophagefferens]|nr:hypothetical protein JL721_2466 [Aureococcus anophagefferens]
MHAASLGYVKVVLALCDPLNRSGVAEDIDADLAEHATRRTALHLAAMCEIEQPKTIRSLCVHGKAEVSAKDKYGHTPLHLASDRKNVSIIRALLDHNADVDARDINGNTPLHSGARGATGAVMVLLQSGSHVDTANKWGDTALHISLMRYHTKDQKLKLSTLGWLDEDQAYGETSLREKLSGFGHGTMRRLGDLAHGDLPAAFGGGRERRLSAVVEVADVAKKGNFEGVVEQLLNGNADLGRRNKHDLPAFSVPLQEHYFNIKKDDLRACSTRHAAVFRSPASIGRAILRFLCAPFAGAPTNQHKTRVADAETPKEGETPPRAEAPRHLRRRGLAQRPPRRGALPPALREQARPEGRRHGVAPQVLRGSVLMLAFYLPSSRASRRWPRSSSRARRAAPSRRRRSSRGAARRLRGGRLRGEDGGAEAREGAAPFDGEALGFDQVTNADDLFHFLETTFAAALDAPAPERWSGDGQESIEVDGRDFLPASGVLGPAALMQWRSRANLCDVPDRAEGMVAFCFREPSKPKGRRHWTAALAAARVWPYLATGAGGGGGGGGDGAGDGGVVLWLEVACFVFARFFFAQEFDQAVKEKYSYLTNPGTSSTSSSSCSWRPTR